MKNLSVVLKELGIPFSFPLIIKDGERQTYYEDEKKVIFPKHDTPEDPLHLGYLKSHHDEHGHTLHCTDEEGRWYYYEYDKSWKETYFTNNRGYSRGKRRNNDII